MRDALSNRGTVLMEPKWNVKSVDKSLFIGIAVLMEPKWNVKFGSLIERIIEWMGINGTKVECKERCILCSFAEWYCINGTKVECKGRSLCTNPTTDVCINGTKVECKGRCRSVSSYSRGWY